MFRNLINKYLSIQILPIWIIFLIDLFFIIVSCSASALINYGLSGVSNHFLPITHFVLLSLICGVIFAKLFHTYANVLRYATFVDIIRVLESLFCIYFIAALYIVLFRNGFPGWRIVLFSFFINCWLIINERILIKILFDRYSTHSSQHHNVFIYGADENGINIARILQSKTGELYSLKGLIMDDPQYADKILMGVRVYPNNKAIISTMLAKQVDTLIVLPAKMEQFKTTGLAQLMIKQRIKLLTVPPIEEWDSDFTAKEKIKEIQIEDLLDREPIAIDMRKVASDLEGKRILITGAAGSIGSEIMRQVATFNPLKMILLDQAETPLHDICLELQDKWRNVDAVTVMANIEDRAHLEQIFRIYKPQYVFHAAAYKHVPMMEENVSEAIRVNVQGTKNIADLSVAYNVHKFVMISTDKAVNPTNVMGCSKRICEIYVQSLAKKIQLEGNKSTNFITTRFGNVLGSNGSVIPRFREQIEQGGPVTVTHPDIIRYFMLIPEACKLVLQAGCMGNTGEIYIFDMGKPVKIYDLARNMIALSGKKNVKIEFTGLRHGEKLYEELLNTKENTKPTYHEKIMIATVREYDFEIIKEKIKALISIAKTFDEMAIVKKMKEIVPEFLSKNSRFEELDAK